MGNGMLPVLEIKEDAVRVNFVSMLMVGSLIAVGGLAAGCGDELEPLEDGLVSLQWEVSPKGCKESGVEEIEVSLENSHFDYRERFVCDAGRATLAGVYPGNYRLYVQGADKRGHVTFEAAARSVTVRGERTEAVGMVRLTAKPASVEVGWLFANGRVCGANGVERVDVHVYDDMGYEVKSAQFACNEGSGVVRDLAAGGYLIEASAQVGGKLAFQGQSEVKLDRGEEGQVDVVMQGK